jgi:type II secretory pathway component PulF
MAHFRYQALNATGQPVAGELHAESVALALAQLEADGLTVQSIGYAAAESRSAEPPPTNAGGQNPFGRGGEQAVLQLHLEKMIERAKVIAPALRAYAEEVPTGIRRRELLTVVQILEGGRAVEAENAWRTLPGYWIPLLGAAASSQDPGQILREFMKESQRTDELRRQWFLALAYPLLVATIASAVLLLISWFVIPIFRDIFTGFGLRLPGFTQLVFTISGWISSGQIYMGAAALALAAAFLWWARRLLPASWRDWLSDCLGTPLGRSTAIARFAQFTADLLEAELDHPNALRFAGMATRSPRIQRAAWRLAGNLEAGGGGTQQPYQPFLTATVLYALQSDMPAATRIRLLREVSGCHADRARAQLSWTHGVIEPILVVVIGGLVGAIVIALFLPLISLVQGLSS